MQNNYKSLRIAVMICATLIDIQTYRQTHTHTDSFYTLLAQQLS